MQFQLIGYFPKTSPIPPAWLHPSHVREICSVSHCVALPPPDWIEHWRHNDFFFFNTIADAESIVPPGAVGYHIFAYRLLLITFSEGRQTPIPAPILPLEPLPSSFVSLGFDAVSKYCTPYFECSPLSCNGALAKYAVNEYCLFASPEEAVVAATLWSAKDVMEPGDYFVLEVLRQSTGA